MKICIDCKYSEEFQNVTPQNQVVRGLGCIHDECRDPVNGAALICQAARGEDRMCGFEARFFEAKEEEATIIT